MSAERDAVVAANDAFYAAFAALDLARMRALWLDSDDVLCVHPGQGMLAGREAVLGSWAGIFAGALAMRFTLRDARVTVVGDAAWVTLVEDIESEHPSGPGRGLVQATNVFRRIDGRWWVVHHHGSPILQPMPVLQ